jgi:hypothetical protein
MPHYISAKALDELLKIVHPKSTILEIGTGEGTQAFTKHYKVISIENDPKWHTGHSELIHIPLVDCKSLPLPNAFWKRFPKATYWYDVEKLREALKTIPNYNAIIVDGPAGGAARAAMWWFYKDLFKLNVPVIVDDIHRQYDWLVAANIASCKKTTEFKVVLSDKGNNNNMFAVIK